MTDDILQSYASHNLLDFEGGNAEFDYLLEASEELLEEITNQNITSFALAAINPNVSIDNAQLGVLQGIIQVKWRLFTKDTKQTDIQRTVLRAVILNAINHLVDNNDKKAAIIWLSCQHIFKYLLISNKEEEKIMHDLIQKAGKRYNVLAKGNFQIVAPEFKSNLSKTSSVRLPVNNDRKASEIQNKLSSIDGIAGTNFRNQQNQFTTGISHPAFNSWLEKFSSKLSTTLEEMTTGERGAIKKYLSDVDKEFETVFQLFAEEIPSQIQTTLHSLSNNNNLIWWKETLFSRSLQDSYRNVPSLVKVISMACDLANELNSYTPISVDYFLKETLLKVQPEKIEVSLDGLPENLFTENSSDYLTEILITKDLDDQTSWSLLDFLGAKLNQKTEVNIKTAIGIDGTKELDYSQLLVWLFHDFQALKLSQDGE